jgi:MtN3 and saliva related transmembrane protein
MNQGLHHLTTRERVYKNLEPYPHPDKAKRIYDEVIYLVGIVSPFVILPQAINVWVYRQTEGISIITWALLGVASSMWLVYGIIHKEKPIIVTNVLLMLFNFSIALGVVLMR